MVRILNFAVVAVGVCLVPALSNVRSKGWRCWAVFKGQLAETGLTQLLLLGRHVALSGCHVSGTLARCQEARGRSQGGGFLFFSRRSSFTLLTCSKKSLDRFRTSFGLHPINHLPPLASRYFTASFRMYAAPFTVVRRHGWKNISRPERFGHGLRRGNTQSFGLATADKNMNSPRFRSRFNTEVL